MVTRPHHGEHRMMMMVTFHPSLLERQIHCRKLRIQIGRFTCPSRSHMMSRSETLHRRDAQQGPTHGIDDDSGANSAVENFHGPGLGKIQDPGRGSHPEKEVRDACAADSFTKSTRTCTRKPSSSNNFPIRMWSPIWNRLDLGYVMV